VQTTRGAEGIDDVRILACGFEATLDVLAGEALCHGGFRASRAAGDRLNGQGRSGLTHVFR